MITTAVLGNSLFGLYWIIWAILAIKPVSRRVFWFESIVPFIAFVFLFWAHLSGLFSNISLIFLFIFSVTHALAAHYTYSSTFWGTWFKEKFKLKRDHFDRLVHFFFGLLAVPLFGDLLQHLIPQVFGKRLFVFVTIVAIGAIFEIFEYIVVALSGPEEGERFLGLQDDIWDAQKDMISETIGALIGIFIFI